MRRAYPIFFIGVIGDYITTQIGLSRGFYETHPLYNPVFAFMIFFSSIALLHKLLGDKYNIPICFIALMSFLGVVNNILVILNIFNGLVI